MFRYFSPAACRGTNRTVGSLVCPWRGDYRLLSPRRRHRGALRTGGVFGSLRETLGGCSLSTRATAGDVTAGRGEVSLGDRWRVMCRLGFDPAAFSAPFVATLVDVTGLIIYFAVGLVILRGTRL